MKPFFILLAALGVPAFFGIKQLWKERKAKKRLQALALAYERLVVEHKLCIEHYDVIGNRVLALDKRARKLLFVDHAGPVKTEICIPLISISQATVVRKMSSAGTIESICLELKHKRTGTPYNVCLFDEAMDPLGDLLPLSRRAMHWKNRIDVYKYPGNLTPEQEFVL